MKNISLILCATIILFSGITRSDGREVPNSAFSDCAVATVKTEYKRSKAVFVGKVTKVFEDADSKIFEFRVEKYWKGVTGKTVKVTVSKTMRFEPFYTVGASYLIYAFGGNDGILRTAKCSRGYEIQYAKEDFKVLGKAKKMH